MAYTTNSRQNIDVHKGFWTNWSYGQVYGATITVSRSTGSLLVAFFALFVAISGGSFWRITCYVLHLRLSSTKPQDGLYHQRQAILRNSTSATVAALDLFRTFWAWKRLARRASLRLLLIAVSAILCASGFIVAGLFSSNVASALGSEVLMSGLNCGQVDRERGIAGVTYSKINPYLGQRNLEYSNYASQCYRGGQSTASNGCATFVKSSLPRKVDRNDRCPFSKEMCISDAGNIVIDTGYLSSLDDFGINAPPEDRFLYRRVHRCAPLVTEGYREVYNGTALSQPASLMRYFYGAPNTGVPGNATYTYALNSTIELQKLRPPETASPDYTLE